MFLLTKYQYYIYIFSPFPPLHFGAAFSVLAFSTTAHWCRVFRSRVFHPCIFDGAEFSVLAFSVVPTSTTWLRLIRYDASVNFFSVGLMKQKTEWNKTSLSATMCLSKRWIGVKFQVDLQVDLTKSTEVIYRAIFPILMDKMRHLRHGSLKLQLTNR